MTKPFQQVKNSGYRDGRKQRFSGVSCRAMSPKVCQKSIFSRLRGKPMNNSGFWLRAEFERWDGGPKVRRTDPASATKKNDNIADAIESYRE
jgi:hypothetical protein